MRSLTQARRTNTHQQSASIVMKPCCHLISGSTASCRPREACKRTCTNTVHALIYRHMHTPPGHPHPNTAHQSLLELVDRRGRDRDVVAAVLRCQQGWVAQLAHLGRCTGGIQVVLGTATNSQQTLQADVSTLHGTEAGGRPSIGTTYTKGSQRNAHAGTADAPLPIRVCRSAPVLAGRAS
jgi:hypothetical protein